ncbi:MAG: hypothetical protein Alpg2KO_01690 [Alphaproteobacteria bacterium]
MFRKTQNWHKWFLIAVMPVLALGVSFKWYTVYDFVLSVLGVLAYLASLIVLNMLYRKASWGVTVACAGLSFGLCYGLNEFVLNGSYARYSPYPALALMYGSVAAYFGLLYMLDSKPVNVMRVGPAGIMARLVTIDRITVYSAAVFGGALTCYLLVLDEPAFGFIPGFIDFLVLSWMFFWWRGEVFRIPKPAIYYVLLFLVLRMAVDVPFYSHERYGNIDDQGSTYLVRYTERSGNVSERREGLYVLVQRSLHSQLTNRANLFKADVIRLPLDSRTRIVTDKTSGLLLAFEDRKAIACIDLLPVTRGACPSGVEATRDLAKVPTSDSQVAEAATATLLSSYPHLSARIDQGHHLHRR